MAFISHEYKQHPVHVLDSLNNNIHSENPNIRRPGRMYADLTIISLFKKK